MYTKVALAAATILSIVFIILYITKKDKGTKSDHHDPPKPGPQPHGDGEINPIAVMRVAYSGMSDDGDWEIRDNAVVVPGFVQYIDCHTDHPLTKVKPGQYIGLSLTPPIGRSSYKTKIGNPSLSKDAKTASVGLYNTGQGDITWKNIKTTMSATMIMDGDLDKDTPITSWIMRYEVYGPKSVVHWGKVAGLDWTNKMYPLGGVDAYFYII